MIRGFLTGAALVILSVLVYLTFHLGFFDGVSIQEESRSPLYLLFQEHRGAYYQIADVINRVEGIAKLTNVPCEQTFGEYLDSPQGVDEDRLRSRGGCVGQQPYLRLPDGLETDQIPKQRYVVARFSGSPAIGPWKVYPKVRAYLSNHRLSTREETIEIYTLKDKTIETEYLFPLK